MEIQQWVKYSHKKERMYEGHLFCRFSSRVVADR
jgi:hypothetical protein